MDDFMRLLTLALAIITVATAAGLGLQRGRVTSLRESLEDARKEIADKDRRLTAAETEVQTLKSDLEALSRVVTGEAHWVAIGHKLDEHHNEATQHWEADEQLLTDIRDRLPRTGGQ